MKKSRIVSLLSLCSVFVILVGCNKYEEGSNFSLYTAKMRITGNWKKTAVTYNGSSVDFNSYKISIKSDNSYSSSEVVFGYTINDNGTWKFNGDKTDIIFTDSDNDVEQYEIYELKNKEFKLLQMDGNNKIISTFQPQ